MLGTILKLVLLALLVAWLATMRGQIDLAWGEWQITARSGAVFVLLLLFAWLCLWGWRGLREMWLLPRHVGLWRRTRRRDAGYHALLQALSFGGALGGEDGKAYLDKALAARRLLNKDSLSTLIAAQVAEAVSDVKQASKLYESLQKHEETRFVALLSLTRLARQSGDYARARAYAHAAESLQPSSLLLRIESIEIARQDLSPQAALELLDATRRHGDALPANLLRVEADLRLDAMRKALESENSSEALRQARLAYEASPQRGIVAYAQRLADGGSVAKAQGRKIVHARWAEFESRALAEVFFRLNDASRPIECARLLETLAGRHGSPKSRLLLCEMLLDAKVWRRATELLEDLANDIEHATSPAAEDEVLSYDALRARLAKEAHNDLEAQQYWLDRLAEHARLQSRAQDAQTSPDS